MTPIKSLGIYFGNNNEECQKLNWENKIEKMNKLFCAWGKRNLSILGIFFTPIHIVGQCMFSTRYIS
jgi:hypothetical protein